MILNHFIHNVVSVFVFVDVVVVVRTYLWEAGILYIGIESCVSSALGVVAVKTKTKTNKQKQYSRRQGEAGMEGWWGVGGGGADLS